MKNGIKSRQDRRTSAGGSRKKRIAAGVITAVLTLCLILGICQGFWNGGKKPEQGQKEDELLAEEKRDKGEGETELQKTQETGAETTDNENPQTAPAADQEGVKSEQNTVIGKNDSEEKNANTGENKDVGENENAGGDTTQGPEDANKPAEGETRHEVGDILEDGSMYTGGDVEAGLDYIRQNPQIWDQLVWH